MNLRAYGGILFDLFGTLVLFRVPAVLAAGQPTDAQRYLRQALSVELPDVAYGDFIAAVRTVSAGIAAERQATGRECSSVERFRRALEALGLANDTGLAERFCLAHMRGLAEATELPGGHLEALRRLARRYPIGLVSNFDHGPTARAILERYGLLDLFVQVVVSDDFGWRKPHPSIFMHAAKGLGLARNELLFVGDTPIEDVQGAAGAGLDSAWINWKGDPFPAELRAPTAEFRSLLECADHLLRLG